MTSNRTTYGSAAVACPMAGTLLVVVFLKVNPERRTLLKVPHTRLRFVFVCCTHELPCLDGAAGVWISAMIAQRTANRLTCRLGTLALIGQRSNYKISTNELPPPARAPPRLPARPPVVSVVS